MLSLHAKRGNMIRYYSKSEGRIKEIETAQPGCWINISPPFTHEELEEVAQQFELPIEFLTDSLDIDERSRYEREDEVRLIVINTPVLNEDEEENNAIYLTLPIGVILTLDNIITIASHENPVLSFFSTTASKILIRRTSPFLCCKSWSKTFFAS